MNVKELIVELQKIENQELEVVILPEEDLFTGDGIVCFGNVGIVQEKDLYLDTCDMRADGGIYKEYDQLVEDREDDLQEIFDVDDLSKIPERKLQEWANSYARLRAVIIEAKVR